MSLVNILGVKQPQLTTCEFQDILSCSLDKILQRWKDKYLVDISKNKSIRLFAGKTNSSLGYDDYYLQFLEFFLS